MRETGVSGRHRPPRNSIDAGTPARPSDSRQPHGVINDVPAAQRRCPSHEYEMLAPAVRDGYAPQIHCHCSTLFLPGGKVRVQTS